jgi:hypothetical protein
LILEQLRLSLGSLLFIFEMKLRGVDTIGFDDQNHIRKSYLETLVLYSFMQRKLMKIVFS